jgi:hypothetical protein
VAPTSAELIRTLYGIDWSVVSERTAGLEVAREAMAPDVQARVSPEVGDRVLAGVDEFALFVQALEEDFSAFCYDAERVEELNPGEVVVTGRIHARGRRSKMPLSAPFSHVWTVRDGVAVAVEARLV